MLILEGEGTFEEVIYPDLYIYINDQQVNHQVELFVVDFDKPSSQRFSVNIEELPKEFTTKFVVKTKDTKAEPIVLLYEHQATPPKAVYTINNINLIKKANKKFLKIEFATISPDDFWSYPSFKVEMNGKLIAERETTTYGLVEIELIPTEIEQLPKDFKCKVTLGQLGNDINTTIYYPSK
ncbi:MAG: hypothetical protein AB8E82_09950 [Aureispira sp.]